MKIFTSRSSGAIGLGVVALILFGPLLPPYYLFLLTEILIWGLFAVAFDILFGYTGMLSFGQSMFFGLGAYGAVLSIIHWDVGFLPALFFAILLSAIFALPAGILAVRVKGHYFVIITVIFSLVLFFIASSWSSLTGGDDGLPIQLKELSIFHLSFSLYDQTTNFYFVVIIASLCFLFLWRVVHSPIGLVFTAIRDNEERAKFLGYDVGKFKLLSFMISSVLSGVAGGLYALTIRYASTNFLYWTVSGEAVVWTVLGGKGTLFGPLLGTSILILVKDELSSYFAIYPILVGGLLIAVILFAPQGVVGLLRDKMASIFGQPFLTKGAWQSLATWSLESDSRKIQEPVLKVEGLGKRFGGVVAVADFSFELNMGEAKVFVFPETSIHTDSGWRLSHGRSSEDIPDFSIVGANAAGKTTLFDLITGYVIPDRGEIILNGEEIFNSEGDGRIKKITPPNKISLKGVARTFQLISLFPNLTVYENIWIAAQSRRKFSNLRFALTNLSSLNEVREKVEGIIKTIGLEKEAWYKASEISNGRQKVLEIGLALATDPLLLLLDEPTAGVSPEETEILERLINRLSEKLGLLIIEHDMEVVRRLNNETYIFNEGRVIAADKPYVVLGHYEVKKIFLGEFDDVAES